MKRASFERSVLYARQGEARSCLIRSEANRPLNQGPSNQPEFHAVWNYVNQILTEGAKVANT